MESYAAPFSKLHALHHNVAVIHNFPVHSVQFWGGSEAWGAAVEVVICPVAASVQSLVRSALVRAAATETT